MTVGLVLGLVGALTVSRVVANHLHGVNSYDPLVFAGSAFLLIGVAFMACAVPARRAAKTEPIEALRSE